RSGRRSRRSRSRAYRCSGSPRSRPPRGGPPYRFLAGPSNVCVWSHSRPAIDAPGCSAPTAPPAVRSTHRRGSRLQEVHVDVVVNARNCEMTDRFRAHAQEKLSRLEKHDHRLMRVEVEVEAERNPRLHDRAVRVELTAFSKGPVIRAEAAAEDKMAAL